MSYTVIETTYPNSYHGPTFGEPWNPAFVTNELDDVSSVSSTPSLSPTSDLDAFPGELVEDEDFPVSPGAGSICQPLDYIYSPPFEPYSFYDYDSSMPVPCSPSRRRSATLPELEPSLAAFNADLFGLHKSVPSEEPAFPDVDMDIPHIRWRSFPGCETDDDLIPMELTSKNHIPDPSETVPTTSTGTRSLLLWNHDYNDRCDMPTPRSPSPENIYLDPTILAECGDEELQNVYELRQRRAMSEKRDRERCRELSALLRLKLDERGVLYGGEGGDCCHDQRGFRSLSSQERPKHKIRSMAQLVASMLFHRQSDVLRRHPSRKADVEPTSQFSHYSPHSSPMGAVKLHSMPRSRLSKVILPEESDMSLSHAFRIDQ